MTDINGTERAFGGGALEISAAGVIYIGQLSTTFLFQIGETVAKQLFRGRG